jgi:hypothetical protein
MTILTLITPGFLIGLFVALAILSVIAAFYGLEYDRRQKKVKEQLADAKELNMQLHEKVGQLEDQLGTVKEELAVKTQMYNGLKEQYNDLEKDFERMNSQAS